MRPRPLALIASLFASVVALHAAPLTLHVAPDGRDSANGRTPATAFASLERARDEIRALKTRAGRLPSGGIVVQLAPGVYVRTASFELTADDSGTPASPIVYRSADPENPARLMGGKTIPLSAFRPVTNPALRTRLAPEAAAHVLALRLADADLASVPEFPAVFDDQGGLFELFAGPVSCSWAAEQRGEMASAFRCGLSEGIPGGYFEPKASSKGAASSPQCDPHKCRSPAEGKRLPLARWPNEGFAVMKRVLVTGATRVPGTFEYADDRPARWTENSHVWLKGQWRVGWEDPAIRVAKIDPAARTIAFAAGIQNGIGYKYITNPDGTRPGNGKEPWHALNLLEEIDRPGEWALDFSSGILYFWPPAGLRELTITQLADPLVSATDVAHVDLAHLDLGYSLGHGLAAENVDHLRLLGSRIHHIAGTAVVLHGRNSTIQSNDLHDLGGGGVRVSGGDSRTLASSENKILNNHIHHYGVLRAQYSAGVDVGFGGNSNHRGRRDAVGVTVSKNRIHDAPRDAILVNGQLHLFELNEISACGFGSADTGCFYSWLDWTIQGVVIRHNFMYDTVGGVNPDDGATGFHVYGNIFAGPRTGVWIASGPDHVVENNIFIKDEGPVFGLDDRGAGRGYATNKHLVGRRDAMQMDTPPWSEKFPGLAARLADRPELPLRTRFERNLIVIPTGDAIQNKVSRANRDNPEILITADNWVTPADPGFVNAPAGDFTLRPDSEAFKRIPGFKPIPFEKIGLQPDAYRPVVPPRPAFKGTPPPPALQPDQDRNFGT